MSHPTETHSTSAVVSEKVRDFYDRYPYPRPVDSLEKYRLRWQDGLRQRAEYHLFWPSKSYRQDFSILIAGCGTSQAVKHALRWPEAQVTGIDFSETSVRYTQKLKKKYNLNNLNVYQLSIEKAEELKTNFDQIVCTGVLHHLPNPDAGLRSLRNLLKGDGAMHLMVYAPYGRTGIYMIQEFCQRIGIEATDDGIRELILALRVLPKGHPLEKLLREAPDFQNEAALADALLHPKDRAYSVPELFELIEGQGFSFGRWLRQAPYTIHCGVLARIPQFSSMANVPIKEQYAAAELFRGTMLRHSVVIYRNDHYPPQRVSFSGEAWLGYIPIRMADTLLLQEQVPPGSEAVLINKNHTYTDLILTIDATEKHLFKAIDGINSINNIMEKTLLSKQNPSQLGKARTFFEKLWRYDQVVFDTSQAN